MKKIFLIIMMIICCISVAACNKNNNNNNNADDEYKCNIQLNYSDSKFSEYTSFDKAKDNISDYDLYEIVVLYYYQEDKVVALDHTKYYITITDANDNIISGLTQDMAVGVYKITFTHFEFVDSKIIIFEVTESKENIPDEGAYILCGNHLHAFDSVFLITNTKRKIHFIAKAELFKHWFMRWIEKPFGLIRVDRNKTLYDDMYETVITSGKKYDMI